MILTTDERDLVRDFTGQAPDDATLTAFALAVDYWPEVALRVLRRRLADLNTGDGIASVSVGGEIAVTFTRADIPTIRAAIYDLESRLAALNGDDGSVAVGRIVRPDRRR